MPAAVVAVDVAAAQRRVRAAVDVAAGDRAAVVVAVLRDRLHELARAERLVLELRAALVDVPAVVLEAGARRRRVVDLLDRRPGRRRRCRGRRSRGRTRSATRCGGRAPRSRSPFVATLSESSLPKSERMFCARFSGSPPEPPSPIVKYSRPFGPKASMPPLWLPYGSRLEKSCRGDGARGVPFVRYSTTLRRAVAGRVLDVELAHLRVGRVEREPEQPLLAARRHEACGCRGTASRAACRPGAPGSCRPARRRRAGRPRPSRR